MKTILVPTDFSANANNAFNYAITLGEVFGSNLILLHSCHIPPYTSEVPLEELTTETVMEEAAKRLKTFSKKKLTQNNKITIEEMVVFGLAVDSIVSTAKEKKADLVIMGTKGATGLEEVMLGSITASVMEKSPCSVLAVPEKATFHGIKKMVFATNYLDHDIQSIHTIAGIAAAIDAEIIIVHVSDVNQNDDYERDLFKQFKEKVKNEVAYKNISFDHLIGLNVAKTLHALVEQKQIDLVALSTRKRNVMTKIFDRSLTKKLAYHTHIPLLSVHV